MAINIVNKNSTADTGGVADAPVPADLEYGELAINYGSADPALFVKDSVNAIVRVTEGAGTVTTAKLADNSVISSKIATGAILNSKVNAAAAIAGTKISPNFGAQNITTTGSIGGGTATFSGDVLQYTTLKTPYYLREPDFDTTGVLTTSKIYNIPTWANRFVLNMEGAETTGSNTGYLVQFGSATVFWSNAATFVNNPNSAYSTINWVNNSTPTPVLGSAATLGGFALGLTGFNGYTSSSHTVFMKMLDRWSSSGTFQYQLTATPTINNRGTGKIFTNPVDFINTPARIRITGNASGPITGQFGVTWYNE